MNHYPALTSLRFLAALLVFLFHFPPAKGALWDIVAGEGHVGVNIFFVLSGFLITTRYGERLGRRNVNLREYLLRRAARILPLYYAVFILCQVVATGGVSLSVATLPEWTLTQALFGESVHHLVIPTSWSLTVEECFYASAPALFLAVALARRRWPRWPLLASAGVLLIVTVALCASGAAIWTGLAGRGPGFLRSAKEVALHTLFGRFCDFAFGAITAQAFVSPSSRRWRALLDRPVVGALAAVVACAAIVASQWGMHAAGGINGPHWAQIWAWGLLLAPATAGLIVSLTSAGNPIARLLGVAPLVYLGKLSYALYLVQLTAIGRGFLYRVVSRQDGTVTLLMLYGGLTVISAILYETVEEPARKLVLRLGGLERKAVPERVAGGTRLVAVAVLVIAVLTQAVSWAISSHLKRSGPVTIEDVDRAGVTPADRLTIRPSDAMRGREVWLVKLPRRWREGWGDDLRAPSALWVFGDGEWIPFSRREPERLHPAAFNRGPRAEYLALRLTELPSELLVVRATPMISARVHLARLLRSPSIVVVGAAFAIALLVGTFVSRGPATFLPRAVAVAFVVLGVWWILGLHEMRWALAVVAAECVFLLALAACIPRPVSRAER